MHKKTLLPLQNIQVQFPKDFLGLDLVQNPLGTLVLERCKLGTKHTIASQAVRRIMLGPQFVKDGFPGYDV